MKEEYSVIFHDAISTIFSNFGFGEVSCKEPYMKEELVCGHSLTTVIGISGDIKGQIAFSMPTDTAKKIASTMMMGMEIQELDDMAFSALGELTNMICGQAIIGLSTRMITADITPPIIRHGNDEMEVLSHINTCAMELQSNLGIMELNLGIE